MSLRLPIGSDDFHGSRLTWQSCSEAPFFPGAIMLMSSWYTRAELGHRIAWFYSGSSLANMFGGLISAGVLSNLEGAHGISGWRWLFIIEGVITVGVSLLAA